MGTCIISPDTRDNSSTQDQADTQKIMADEKDEKLAVPFASIEAAKAAMADFCKGLDYMWKTSDNKLTDPFWTALDENVTLAITDDVMVGKAGVFQKMAPLMNAPVFKECLHVADTTNWTPYSAKGILNEYGTWYDGSHFSQLHFFELVWSKKGKVQLYRLRHVNLADEAFFQYKIAAFMAAAKPLMEKHEALLNIYYQMGYTKMQRRIVADMYQPDSKCWLSGDKPLGTEVAPAYNKEQTLAVQCDHMWPEMVPGKMTAALTVEELTEEDKGKSDTPADPSDLIKFRVKLTANSATNASQEMHFGAEEIWKFMDDRIVVVWRKMDANTSGTVQQGVEETEKN
mmetsp:Transcript_47289/g.78475  ORF Transcript_47289/g.78475 Transcript_47289/m.78475 type:complete len:343 (+) Transcript_47289:40-1068(+)